MIRSNPADRVERPRKEKFKSEIYSGEELEQLFTAIQGDPAEFGVIMAAFYGLRRSEVVGLKWDAIDFENKKIGIQHTVVTAKVNGTLTEIARDKTKTKSSCRTLPLIPACEQMLKKMKKEQEQNRKVCGRSYCTDYLDYIYCQPGKGQICRSRSSLPRRREADKRVGRTDPRLYKKRRRCSF